MKKYIIFLAATTMWFACNQESSKIKNSPISGYDYEVFIANDGDHASVGDHVFFSMDIYDDRDSLLQTYKNQKILPSVKILDQSDPTRKKNPVLDIASYLALGDSVAILVPVDSVPNMPPGYDDIEHIEYHITIAEILTAEEFDIKMKAEQEQAQAEMERLRTMIPEVEAFTSKILADYKAGKLDLEETAGGVKYFIHERGNGTLPTNDRMVTMQYYGMTVDDGKMFDNSFNRGKGYTFRLGRGEVIRGWDEATPYLPVGSKASIFIPAELGYGAQGSPPAIPANAELYFYVIVDDLYY